MALYLFMTTFMMLYPAFRNWPERRKISFVAVPNFVCTQLSFNPMNWRQICGTNREQLVLWNIEQLNETYHLITR